MRAFRVGSILVVLLVIAALGVLGILRAGEEIITEEHHISWEAPIVNGMEVTGTEKADRHVPFDTSAPRELGDPVRILVTRPVAIRPKDRIVTLEYRHPKYGRFLVLQATSHTTEEDLKGLAAQCRRETGCEAEASLKTLDDGTFALLLEGPTATSMTFLHGPVRFDLIGSSDSFTAERAEAVAATF